MEPAANSSHEHRPGISGILPIKIDERECRGVGRSVARGPLDVNGTRRNVLGYGSFANWNRLPGPGASFFRGTLPVPPRRKPTHNYRATRSVASRVFPFSAESALARVTSDPRGRINSCFSTFESAPRDICRHHLLTADFFSFPRLVAFRLTSKLVREEKSSGVLGGINIISKKLFDDGWITWSAINWA